MAEIQELLDYVQEHTQLDVIAITDHDEIAGGYLARELVAKGHYRFEVVVGMEVSTLDGHLLALFIEEPVLSLRPLAETVEAVHVQGGLCVVPHPCSWLTRSIGKGSLEKIMSHGNELVYFDGLEMANPTIAGRVGYEQSRRLNDRRFHLAEMGGSDAHFLAQIGVASTTFPGRTAADLRQAILRRTTRGVSHAHPKLKRLGYGKIVRQQCRSLFVLPFRLIRKPIQRLLGS
jgi:predicted metal-dependent phosphoesterase TrpH